MRMCKKCLVEKPESEFYRANKGTTYFTECKACSSARAAAWAKRKREEDPGYSRRSRLRQLYKITPEQYDAMLEAQGGVCAICGTDDPQTGRGHLFPVDHDHATGEPRGLTCQPCNTGLGGFKDDIDRLMAAAAYLLARQDVLGAVSF